MTYAVQATDLSFSFQNRRILDNISFEIHQGEIIYVIGGNGSGKTTLLKLIIGIIKPDSGIVKIMGKLNKQNIVAEYIGYVPQYFNIERNFPISVEEMIRLECTKDKKCPITPERHLKYLNSEGTLKKRISDLSGGEMQKVLIARSMVTNPAILLLDEPFNNLDHRTETDFIKMLKQINTENKTTIILVTHDMSIIRPDDKRTKILFLAHGKARLAEANEFKDIHKLGYI